jgi:hypothetical protein
MQDDTLTPLRADDGGSAQAIKRAMDELRAKRITPGEFRAVMRASRKTDPAGHDRRKFAAATQAARLPGGGS